MKCVILQPSYIPWRGYFHQIQKADVFVFYDDVQYDKHGWRNRNLIKGPNGPQWLTIPVASKGAVSQHIPISEVRIVWDRDWTRTHWGTLTACYARSPFFGKYAATFESFYQHRPERLADYTIETTISVARMLGIEHTRFVRSSELDVTGSRTERLVNIVKEVGALHYISGPSARLHRGRRIRACGDLARVHGIRVSRLSPALSAVRRPCVDSRFALHDGRRGVQLHLAHPRAGFLKPELVVDQLQTARPGF